MLTELVTPASCDRLLNLLWDSYRVYREDHEIGIEDDPDDERILRLAALLDNLAHEAWVPGYLLANDRAAVDRALDAADLRFRPRLGQQGYEITTAGVRNEVLTNAEVVEEDEVILVDGETNARVYTRRTAMRYEQFEAVAREAILDCALRMGNPSFELRSCVHDGRYFVPRRAGRGRFCSDSCRAAFSARDDAFRCGFCERALPPRSYSGLIIAPDRRDNFLWFSQESEAPNDLRMAPYHPWRDRLRDGDEFRNRSVCVNCVLEHRSQWARYVASVETSAKREAV